MEPVRVIGRVDLAQQIHAALVSEGADARLATAAPMAVVAETGRDGTGIDVLANAFELCSSIKKAAQGRPVVMVTFEEGAGATPTAEAYAAQIARTSRGPDAHLPWPASGVEILAACERARNSARIFRPRFLWQRLVLFWGGLVAFMAAAFWASGVQAGPNAAAGKTTLLVAALVKLGLCALALLFIWARLRRSRTTARSPLLLALGSALGVVIVGQAILDLVKALLR
jgi:hypothetical protein